MSGERLICPECGALLWHYPDGRETCSRCEYEEPQPKSVDKYYPMVTQTARNPIFLGVFVLESEMDDLRRTT
jgi:ribosomal protein L40E